jgi:hypothetical protein
MQTSGQDSIKFSSSNSFVLMELQAEAGATVREHQADVCNVLRTWDGRIPNRAQHWLW